MDFNDTPEEASFRKEVNDWLSSNASLKKSSQDSGMAGMGEEDALKNAKKWAAKLYESGWSCLHWPKEYGGRGSTPIERVIW